MFTLRKVQSERGFMSVESIANSLFYLIMIAVVTLIASKVMNSGKMAATASTLSMLRSNIQYVGVNAGDYSNIAAVHLPQLIPGLVKYVDPTTPVGATGVLPTGQVVTVGPALAGDPDEEGSPVAVGGDNNLFRMAIAAVPVADCRKLAYYGIGGGYGVMVGTTVLDTPADYVTDVEAACVVAAGALPNVILVSR